MISGKLNQPFRELTSELDSLTKLTSKSIVKDRFLNRLKEILRNGTNIEKSLKRVLLWSKLQRNRYEVQSSEINLNDYLHEMLPDMLAYAIKKDIRIRFDVDQELSIYFDKHSLKTIIRILIENSVDNSDPKSDIIIRGQSARTGSIISITDFGTGIPGWLQSSLFDINRQSGEPETVKLGISLLIAKSLAEINNSSISFESNQKKGTTFFIHISEKNG
jgi:K+-sensing histidine kinase KdpD